MIRFKNPFVEKEAALAKRLIIFYLGLTAGYLIIVGRAVFLMLEDNQRLEEIAMTQYRSAIQQETQRNQILDARGQELAISVPAWALYANPGEIKNVAGASLSLAKILNGDRAKITEKLKEKRKFVWIQRHLSEEKMQKVQKLALKGIYGFKENMRFYPHGELGGNILGAVGIDSQPLGGIELAYNPYLMIASQKTIYLKDARGKLYGGEENLENNPGKGHVYLTIDKNLQFFSEQALKEAVAANGAKSGIFVMMDPKTGDILAMANYPAFDPNQYQSANFSAWRNRAITDIYEPGSTFKVIVVAAALENHLLKSSDRFNCEGGSYLVPRTDKIVHDHKPHGMLSVQDIIKVSSNIGSVKIGQKVGREKFYQKMREFGFGQKTGIDFPGESSGMLRTPQKWNPLDEATMAFGHGIGVTPLQILSAYGAIANGGVMMQAHLVEKVLGEHGEIAYQAQHREVSRPILPGTAKILTKMLQGVVEDGGTSTLAGMEEFEVAGKSGTTIKVDEENGGYLDGKYIASFVGFAPAENPRLVALVLFDEPKSSYYGGVVAAPVFQEVMRNSLHYLGFAPNNGNSKMWMVKKEESPHRISPQSLAFGREGNYYVVPDFTGTSMREVLKTANNLPVSVAFEGRGEAMDQNPKPGSYILAGSKIYVRFEPLYR